MHKHAHKIIEELNGSHLKRLGGVMFIVSVEVKCIELARTKVGCKKHSEKKKRKRFVYVLCGPKGLRACALSQNSKKKMLIIKLNKLKSVLMNVP